jgi:hypothetical protein
MEQLLALNYNDSTSTVVGPTTPGGGTGLGPTGATTSGSVYPNAPTVGYVDYITSQELYQASATGAQYRREWLIQANNTTNVKTITVRVDALFTAQAAQSLAPSTTLVAMKNQY